MPTSRAPKIRVTWEVPFRQGVLILTLVLPLWNNLRIYNFTFRHTVIVSNVKYLQIVLCWALRGKNVCWTWLLRSCDTHTACGLCVHQTWWKPFSQGLCCCTHTKVLMCTVYTDMHKGHQLVCIHKEGPFSFKYTVSEEEKILLIEYRPTSPSSSVSVQRRSS